jgi:hypothetical protein
MPANEGVELRDAFKSSQDEHATGVVHRGDAALERALLRASAAGLEEDRETVAGAVRLLQAADDNGTTRLEVRDQAMTHRRWFEVDANGDVKWGER